MSQSAETDANMAIRTETTISCMLIVIPEIHKNKFNFLFQLCGVLFYAFLFRPRAVTAQMWTAKCPTCPHCYFAQNNILTPTLSSCSRRPLRPSTADRIAQVQSAGQKHDTSQVPICFNCRYGTCSALTCCSKWFMLVDKSMWPQSIEQRHSHNAVISLTMAADLNTVAVCLLHRALCA
jgi:hypothetical protein